MGNQPTQPTKELMPPEEWRQVSNTKQFHLISPSSDLSNPSQFRHRQTTATRRRQSKVLHKNVPIKHMAPPMQFYFGNARQEEDDDEPPRHNTSSVQLRQQKISQSRQRRRAWLKAKKKNMRDNTQRAKKAIVGCWEDHKLCQVIPEARDNHVHHQRLPSMESSKEHAATRVMVPKTTITHAAQFRPALPNDINGVLKETSNNFQPVWRENRVMESFLHDPEEMVERIADTSATPTLWDSKEEDISNVRLEEQDPTSPVINLFEKEEASPFDEHNLDQDLESPVYSLTSPTEAFDAKSFKDTRKNEYMNRRSMEEQVQQQIDQQLMTMNRPSRSRGSSLGTAKSRRSSQTRSRRSSQTATKVEDLRDGRILSQADKILQARRRTSSPSNKRRTKQDPPAAKVERKSSEHAVGRPSATSLVRPAKMATVTNPKTETNASSIPILLQLAGWKENAKNAPAPKKKTTVSEDENKLPILLKLAGWDDKRSSTASMPVKKPEVRKVRPVEERNSDPLPVQRPEKSDKASIASMLQATYPVAAVCGKDNRNHLQKHQVPQLQTPSSVASSVADTPMSSASGTVGVSDEVLGSAAFLFSPSYNNGQVAVTSHHRRTSQHSSTFSLSTFESRSRVSGSSRAAMSAPIPGHSSESIDQVPRESTSVTDKENSSLDRHVRFSLAQVHRTGEGPTVSVIPEIKHTFSDLTDNTSVTGRSSGTGSYTHLKPSVSPIPEVSFPRAAEDDVSQDSAPHDEKASNNDALRDAEQDEELVVFEDNEEETPTNGGVSMGWTYRAGDDTGVTPFRKGNDLKKATNSPFLRFKDAQSKFRTEKLITTTDSVSLKSKVSQDSSKSSQGTKSSSGLVGSRIAAMEGQSSKQQQRPQATRKPRRATTGHKVLAPRRAKLVSPMFSETKENEQGTPATRDPSDQAENHSPMMVNGVVVNVNAEDKKTTPDTVKSDGTTNLERIMNPPNVDEQSTTSSRRYVSHLFTSSQPDRVEEPESETDDEFAAILNEDDDSTIGCETLPTVLQTGKPTNGRLSTGDDSTIATVSVATVPQKLPFGIGKARNSSSTVYRNAKTEGPFREAAPVRPNELNSRAANPGALCLSPMQRTPMQARKWRALAAAAHEKDSKRNLVASKTKMIGRGRRSLTERNPNVVYHN